MKNILIVTTLLLLIVACSSPKYTASFSDHKTPASYYEAKEASVERETLPPIVVNPKELISSVAQQPVDVADAKAKIKNMYFNMPKEKREELRQQLKWVVKNKDGDNKSINVPSLKVDPGLSAAATLFVLFMVMLLVGIALLIFGSPLLQILGIVLAFPGSLSIVYGLIYHYKIIRMQKKEGKDSTAFYPSPQTGHLYQQKSLANE